MKKKSKWFEQTVFDQWLYLTLQNMAPYKWIRLLFINRTDPESIEHS